MTTRGRQSTVQRGRSTGTQRAAVRADREVKARLSYRQADRFAEACKVLDMPKADLLRALVRIGLKQLERKGKMAVWLNRVEGEKFEPWHRSYIFEGEMARLVGLCSQHGVGAEAILAALVKKELRRPYGKDGCETDESGEAVNGKLVGVLCLRVEDIMCNRLSQGHAVQRNGVTSSRGRTGGRS